VLRLAPAAGHGWPSSPRRRALARREGSSCHVRCRDDVTWLRCSRKVGAVDDDMGRLGKILMNAVPFSIWNSSEVVRSN
jgi:hypothetical protein